MGIMARDQNGLDRVDASLQLRAVFGALYRRKWVVVGTVVLGVAAVMALAALVAPRYTATAAVMIEPRHIGIFNLREEASNSQRGDDSLTEDQLKVIGSRSNIEEVIEELGLAQDPEFNVDLRSPDQSGPIGSLFHAVTRMLQGRPPGSPVRDGGRPAAPNSSAQHEAVFQRVLWNLRTRREGQSNVLTVSFTSINPEKAAKIANAIVDTYMKESLADKVDLYQHARLSLADQLRQLRRQVDQADRTVEEYRAAHRLTDTKGDALSARRLSDLKRELVTARADRIAKDARVRRMRELQKKGNYQPVTELASSPIIANLLRQQDELVQKATRLAAIYGKKNPLVVQVEAEKTAVAKKLDQEVNNVIDNFEQEADVARAHEQALMQALDEATRQFAVDASAGVQLNDLEREANSKRAVYDQALMRLQQIKEEEGILQPDGRIISRAAVPNEPSFPRARITAAVGSIVSLILGAALAALLEHLDRGLRTGRQVEDALGIPTLGLMPKIPSMKRPGMACQYVLDKPLSAYAEAVKSTFVRMELSGSVARLQVVLVTSALPGEGKTTLATSLGALLARAGHKTIVVDLDLRHPGVAREFGEPSGEGLAELLAGDRTLEEVIRPCRKEANLHIIPAGSRTGSSMDAVASRVIALLVTDLRARYEYIVLDSPPVLGFSDANLAATFADAVLFVVQWEKTSELVAANGLEVLARTHAPIAGVALTQVDIHRHRKYGYGDIGQYYSKYLASYEN